jgi:hypothetical protein
MFHQLDDLNVNFAVDVSRRITSIRTRGTCGLHYASRTTSSQRRRGTRTHTDEKNDSLKNAAMRSKSLIQSFCRNLTIVMLRCGTSFSADELAVMTGLTPQEVEEEARVLYNTRIIVRTPANLFYVVPAIRYTLRFYLPLFFSRFSCSGADLVDAPLDPSAPHLVFPQRQYFLAYEEAIENAE